MTKRLSDLPHDLVGEKILSKVPIASLREVRSTCKLWNRLSKTWIVGKAAARQHQFLGFMTKDFKVCSLRFHLRRKEEEVNLPHLSITQVDILNQIEISKVFHSDGLLLCVVKDNSKLVAWNPYLGQTRSISPTKNFHTKDNYLFGYDMNRNHKLLRFLLDYEYSEFEIYDFSSHSWRVLEVTPDWKVGPGCRGVSLKGNTYFWAHEKIMMGDGIVGDGIIAIVINDREDFLLCFDFTTERFGQRLSLPFHSLNGSTVTVSSFRDEKLALLHQKDVTKLERIKALEIWVTTKIEPNDVSWSKFMNVDMRPLIGDCNVRFKEAYGSFFIDEEEKIVVVFDIDGYERTKTAHYHTAFIIGDDGYYRTQNLGEAPNTWKPYSRIYSPPLVCSSSYLPSLLKLNQQRKRKESDEY